MLKSTWGKKRAEAGHPKPFNLKYIGIGNEDLISDIFEERFKMIFDAVKDKYPEIQVIGTSGPFYEGTDYVEGWRIAKELQVPLIDEHYYNPPGWFIHNQNFYDKYDRKQSKVYLGEYAAHLPGRASTIETALAEALHLCNVERNADVVTMTSYAPLLAKLGHTQWNPDLIYFDNTSVKPTVGYYVQQLFGQHAGNKYVSNSLQLSNGEDAVQKRVTSSVVYDDRSGELILKIVNLLPVPVTLDPQFSGLDVSKEQTVDLISLTGEPSDKATVPTTKSVRLDQVSLSPYSFAVMRVKVNNQ